MAEIGQELHHVAPRQLEFRIEEVTDLVEFLELLLPDNGIPGHHRCIDGRARPFVFLVPSLEKLHSGI